MAQLLVHAVEADLKEGVQVWFLNSKKQSWEVGKVVALAGQKVKVQDTETGDTFLVEKTSKEVHKYLENAYDPKNPDLFNMNDLHSSTLLWCVAERFESLRQQYTRMGEMIVSLNPFQPMPYNQGDQMDDYVSEQGTAPHCWQVAHKAFRNIVIRDEGNQSILISGESGAGKTETAKTLLQYLGRLSHSNSSHAIQKELCSRVSEQLKDSNPILESFGNAKTVRNDNSSRFGKYIKLVLQAKSGVIIGAQMVTYLLEKSRIVTQSEGERGYHVFYEFLAGTTPQEKLKFGGLKDATHYRCLNQGNCFQRRSTDGQRVEDDAKSYRQLLAAMQNLGITEAEREQIFTVLAAILHLQNVEFGTDPNTGKATIRTPDGLRAAAGLLGVDAAALGGTFTTKSTTNIMTTLSTQKEASDLRDAVSKALYQSVFDWLVAKLNGVIQGQIRQVPEETTRYIGLLDIFGFENFKSNSFEQMCINYTNEALANHYNKYTFVEDAQECEKEGIPLVIDEYPDNQPCVDLIEGKAGLITVLDAETHFKLGTDEGFTEKAWGIANPFFIKPKSTVPNIFGIHHYAGDVMYNTPGFLEKNADTLKDEVRDIMSASTASEFIRHLLPPVSEDVKSGRVKRSTVASKFRTQLTALRAELASTQSHFIRCVKPNPECRPLCALKPYVLSQLNSAGVVQTIQIKREGYPVRITHADFWRRFRFIAPVTDRRAPDGDDAGKCERLLRLWAAVVPISGRDYAIGYTKVFMKPAVVDFLEHRRGRNVQRLFRAAKPRLHAWVARFREQKAQLEALRAEQERLKFASHTDAEVVGFAAQQAGLGGRVVSDFEELARIFPHFDLPVLLGVVENTETRQQATDILMDMQRQRVDQHLPRSMKLILDLAGLRTEIQEKMVAKDIQTKDQVFGMSDADMEALGFNATEKEKLKAIILSQQSNWVAQERLNQIYPLQPLGPTRLRPVPAVSAVPASALQSPASSVSRVAATQSQPPQPPARPNLVICKECFQYFKPEELPPHEQEHQRHREQAVRDEEFARRLQEEEDGRRAATRLGQDVADEEYARRLQEELNAGRPPPAKPPAAAAPDAGAHSAQINQILAMGFSRAQALDALNRTQGNVQAALDILLSQ
eukprot:EG_transcript_1100